MKEIGRSDIGLGMALYDDGGYLADVGLLLLMLLLSTKDIPFMERPFCGMLRIVELADLPDTGLGKSM